MWRMDAGKNTVSAVSTAPAVEAAVRVVAAEDVREMFLTVRAPAAAGTEDQARAVWGVVADALAEHEAFVVEERVFLTTARALPACRAIRAEYLAARDGGVEPMWLTTRGNDTGGISGLVLRAIGGGVAPATLRFNGRPSARRWCHDGYAIVTGTSFGSHGSDALTQAREMFAAADTCLKTIGLGWDNVARTWLWLRDILGWYGSLNEARNELFRARGLFDAGGEARLPASTGIGVAPAAGGYCALDWVAETGGAMRRLARTSRQGAAFRYGSAFSRAVSVESPFGRHVYVSGTASIGADGTTRHAGQADAQIEETLRAVCSALREAAGTEKPRVVQALVYCKTADVERIFRRQAATDSPCLTLYADICRPDLVFEIECLAVVENARSP